MQVFVQGQTLHTFNVSQETTVDQLKTSLVETEGIPLEEQILSYGGFPLEDDDLLIDAVQEQGTLSLSARVVGGKTHLHILFSN